MLEGYIREYCCEHNILVDALIELTYQCNLQCKHCYIENRSKILSKNSAIKILDRLFQEGTMNLSLTGGEIFLYPYFDEVYRYAKTKGFIIELKTNALLINEKWIDVLKKNMPEEINISVYGLTNKEYYDFTGDERGFEKLTQALDLLYSNDINFSLHVIASTENYINIVCGLYQEFFKKYNVEFEFDYDILSGVEGNQRPLQYRLKPEQIVNIENNDHYYLDSIEHEYAIVKGKKKPPFTCYAGKGKIGFDPDGNALSCMYDTNVKYDAVHTNWTEMKEKLYKRNMEINSMYKKSKCYTCNEGILCRICPLKHGRISPDFRMEDKCKISDLRHKMIEDNKEIYKIQIDDTLLLKFHYIEINLEIENYGINAQDRIRDDNYFSSISNPVVKYIINGFSVEGSKGKSVFYVPIKDKMLAQNLGIMEGNALKIIKDVNIGNVNEMMNELDKMKKISNYLYSKEIAPKCTRVLLLRNLRETLAFNNAKLMVYPANSLFFALEVQHMESVEFGKERNLFNGAMYDNNVLVDRIGEYLKSINITPSDLWVGNLLNTERGIMLIDFYNWEMDNIIK